jgi:hypothetical protein
MTTTTQKLNIQQSSRLRYMTLFTHNEFAWFDQYDYPEIPPANDDDIFEVSGSTVQDVLAFRFYPGDPSMWWVVCRANGIDLFTAEVYPGMKLRVPKKARVDSLFAQWRTGR